MVIDATTSFSAKLFANTMQRDVGKGWKVQVEYSSRSSTPWNWYDIEFSLLEKATGKVHMLPEEIFE